MEEKATGFCAGISIMALVSFFADESRLLLTILILVFGLLYAAAAIVIARGQKARTKRKARQ